MIISIGSDHSGFELKLEIIEHLKAQGHTVKDVGAFSKEPCDYPDITKLVCDQILDKEAEKGVLICGTGIGMSICANRNAGIRAALCTTEQMASKSRLHNDANIIVLGAKILDAKTSLKFIDIFFQEKFEGGRHVARLNKFN